MLLNTENSFREYPNIITTKELQEMLRIGKNTALTLLQCGEIKSIRIGNRYKIPKVNVIEYINRQSISA